MPDVTPTPLPAPPPPPGATRREPRTPDGLRRAVRPAEGRLLSGVSVGLADHLGVAVVWVRLVFAIGVALNGAGLVAYLLLWRFMPVSEAVRAPGLEAAARSGLRPDPVSSPKVPAASIELSRAIAAGAIGIGVVLLVQVSGLGWTWSVLAPATLAVIGIAVVWQGLDDARVRRGHATPGLFRIGAGVALFVAAGLYVVTADRGLSALVDAATVAAFAVAGLALLIGPWVGSLLRDLSTERRERIRSQERADVAAHLHDSVLQTLALLQRQAHDPVAVATLARRQERELRDWLYRETGAIEGLFAGALRASLAEVEDDHAVPIEVVLVGDVPLDSDLDALVRATREATINAAKHAGAPRVDVYAEVGPGAVEVFVRDRGRGFDPETVPDDRQGLRGSVMDRMRRHGGTVTVRSATGAGTEIRLRMPRAHPEGGTA